MLATPEDRAESRRIARALSKVGFVLPGTLTERLMACGKPNCRCHGDPPRLHGPYDQWTRKVGNKTATRFFSDELLNDYGDWFKNERTLRSLVVELESLSLSIIERDHRWKR